MRSAWRHDIDHSKRKHEPGILTGVRTICRYLKMGTQTFYMLQAEHDLPVMQLPDGRWCTSRNLIDDWIVSRWRAQKAASKQDMVESREGSNNRITDAPGSTPGHQGVGREELV